MTDVLGPSTLDRAKAAGDRRVLEQMLCTELASQIRMAAVDDALNIVADEDLHHGTAATIVAAIRRMREDRVTVDYGTITDALRDRGHLAAVGGVVGMLEWCGSDFRSWSVDAVARVVAEWARRGRMKAAGERAAAAAAAGDSQAAIVALAEVERESAGLEHGIDRLRDIPDEVFEGAESPGVRVGWRQLDAIYRVEPGLLTVVTGWPGSSKSTIVDNMAVRLADRHGWRFAVFSPESAPTARHARRLAAIACGKAWNDMSMEERTWHVGWVDEHFEWVNATESVDFREVLRRAEVIRRRKGIDGFVIDPWNEIEHARARDVTETQHISACLSQLRRWGRRHSVHCWVVAHPKKPEYGGGEKPPHLSMIAGSETWRDKCDMGLVIHRDQVKGGPTTVAVHKVRFQAQGAIGKADLMYRLDSGCYFDIAQVSP